MADRKRRRLDVGQPKRNPKQDDHRALTAEQRRFHVERTSKVELTWQATIRGRLVTWTVRGCSMEQAVLHLPG